MDIGNKYVGLTINKEFICLSLFPIAVDYLKVLDGIKITFTILSISIGISIIENKVIFF